MYAQSSLLRSALRTQSFGYRLGIIWLHVRPATPFPVSKRWLTSCHRCRGMRHAAHTWLRQRERRRPWISRSLSLSLSTPCFRQNPRGVACDLPREIYLRSAAQTKSWAAGPGVFHSNDHVLTRCGICRPCTRYMASSTNTSFFVGRHEGAFQGDGPRDRRTARLPRRRRRARPRGEPLGRQARPQHAAGHGAGVSTCVPNPSPLPFLWFIAESCRRFAVFGR